MKILMFGGFLGSGKTSVINLIMESLLSQGTVAIIENEIGELGIDQDQLEDPQVTIKPLFGGCVCCEISGSLVGAIEEISDQVDPDFIIIELTGLATLDNMREVFREYSQLEAEVYTISVVDAGRIDQLLIMMEDFIGRQVGGADLILVNKIDIRPLTQDTREELQDLSPDGQILEIAATQADPQDLASKLKDLLEGGK